VLPILVADVSNNRSKEGGLVPRVSSEIVITGLGETAVGRLPGWNSVQLQAMAVLAAVQDAGLTVRDVDGLINLDPYADPQSMFSTTLAEYLGITPSWVSTVDVGGTVSGMTMLQQAIWAIESGYCTTVVCVYGENTLTGRADDRQGLDLHNKLGAEEWEDPFGAHGMVVPYALLSQRYLDLYGGDYDDFAAVAVNTRRHAQMNENAQMRKPLDMEMCRQARPISTPLRLFDCSLISDGAGAIVLQARTKRLNADRPAVRVSSFGVRCTHNYVAEAPDLEQLGMADAAAEAFNSAGIGPEDFDLAELHDAFTISVLYTLEALGICKPGRSGAWIRAGHAAIGGKCPVNTHGGLLSQAHIGGMLHITEAVRQLRGEAANRQVEGARRAVVSGNGGVFSVCGVMVMERDDVA